MAGPDEDEALPPAPQGFSGGRPADAAGEPPTSPVAAQPLGPPEASPTGPAGAEPAAAPAPAGSRDATTQAGIEYAEPVDPWATAEAAAIAEGAHPGYGAPGPPSAGNWTIPGATEPTAEDTKQRKRGRTLLIAGVAGVVVAIVAAAAVIFWPGYPALDYQRVELLKSISPKVPISSVFTDAEVLGDRAYFAGATGDGDLHVVAADTESGDVEWESDAAGRATSWKSMYALPSVVVLLSGPDSASGSRIVVLDAENDGKLLWERRIGYSDDIVLGSRIALWSDRTGKRLVGLGLSDGVEKWAEPDPDASAIHQVVTRKDLTGPAGTTGRPFAPDLADDERFVQVDADRTATVRDMNSGRTLKTRANVASTSDQVVAYDDRLFVLEPSTVKRIFAYDLAGFDKGQPDALREAAPAEDISKLTPCGELLCFISTSDSDKTTNRVVAVGGEGGWEVTVPEVETLVPVGDDAVLATGDEGTTLIVDGRTAWTDAGVSVRLDAGNVLRFSDELKTSLDTPAVSGFHVGDEAGEIEELGTLRDVRPSSCAWNTSVIACAAEKEYVIYTFAG